MHVRPTEATPDQFAWLYPVGDFFWPNSALSFYLNICSAVFRYIDTATSSNMQTAVHRVIQTILRISNELPLFHRRNVFHLTGILKKAPFHQNYSGKKKLSLAINVPLKKYLDFSDYPEFSRGGVVFFTLPCLSRNATANFHFCRLCQHFI